MSKFVVFVVVSTEPLKSVFLNMVNSRLFGRCRSTVLSIDWDLDPAENVKDLRLTLSRLGRARASLSSAFS